MDELPTNLRPELLLSHAAWLRRLAGTLVVDAGRADDVAQETLLHALERPPAQVASPRAWLATAARNLARTFRRGERRREEHERRGAADVRLPATDEVVARTELHHEIVGAVLALAEPYRTTVLLRFFEEQKPGAIARRMSVPVETVRTRLKRGVELLRGELVRRRANAAVALIGLLDSGLRHSVRRALLANAAGAATASTTVGVVVMSLKVKLAAAVVVVALGTLAVVKLRDAATSPRPDAGARSEDSATALANAAGTRASSDAAPIRTSVESPASVASVRGRVVDVAGHPIVGASVGVLPVAVERTQATDPPRFQFGDGAATTDGSGAFTLALSDPQAIVEVGAVVSRFQPAVWSRARAGDDVVLTLTANVELSGVVRDLSGAPVGGATVRCLLTGKWQLVGETTSVADGTYRFADGIASGVRFGDDDGASPAFQVVATGYAPLLCEPASNLREVDERHWQMDLWLVRGATIRGRVVDLDSGAPVAGADVWLSEYDTRAGHTPHRTKSAGDGGFVLDGLPAWGVTLVGIHSPNLDTRTLGELFAAASDRGMASRSIDVPDDGAEMTVELRLPRTGGVRGRVVDAAGNPVAGASILTEGSVGLAYWHAIQLGGVDRSTTRSDANGRYELTRLSLADGPETVARLSGNVELVAGANDAIFSTATAEVRLIADQIVEAPDLVATRPPGSVVHVVDEHGRDVVGAKVIQWERTDAGPRPDDLNMKTGTTGRCFLRVPTRKAEAPRDLFVSVTATGFAGAKVDVVSETADLTISLQPEHRLHGTVREVDGRPGFADVIVLPADEAPADFVDLLRRGEAWREFPSELVVRGGTVAAGRFVVRGAGPGPWRVVASRYHGDTRSCEVSDAVEVADESKEIDFVLKGSAEPEPPWGGPPPPPGECGRVELTLTFADSGKPILRAGNVWLSSGKRDLEARETAPGRYAIEGVRAGPCTLRIDVRGAARETRSLVVAAGQTTAVAVSITPGLIARGRLKLADLPSFKSAGVLFESDDGGGNLQGEIGSDGSFAAPGLVAGRSYRLWAWLQESEEQSGLWVADEPARSAVDVADWSPHLVPAGVVHARFRDADHFPDGVTMRVFDLASNLVYTRAPAREYGFERVVPVGDYVVKVEVPGLETQEQSVSVRQHELATELYFKSR